ncbi:tex261 protein [Anaeramoeba flamelloides]|uniref:Tex261 protein n=1 Tax=Anaeramoeba flamelloides TaxID=1746091 RepID=A0AAV8A2D3_9EUKA|nr:tex261 protein [Anaeramoeba flamelloides]KAJ6233282.1 tex261 protein [Anaeramoeba flamelloides]
MVIYQLATIISYVVFICFVFIALVAGMYYFSEISEENPSKVSRVIRWLIYLILALHVGFLLFEGFPFLFVTISMLTHVSYLSLLQEFPTIKVKSKRFIISVVGAVLSNFLWFKYFLSVYVSLIELVSFFTLCAWIVPFIFFSSLITDEELIPTTLKKVFPKKQKI